MLEPSLGGAAAAVLIALCPALLHLTWTRSLARRNDDPLLPERLAAQHRSMGLIAFGCFVLIGIGWPRWLAWAIPLSIFAEWIALFPVRKVLFQETWSLAAWMSFKVRLNTGLFGFWFLVAMTPFAVRAAGRFDLLVAPALALLLAAWQRYWTDVLRRLSRARPIADRALLDRFTALVTASGVTSRFEYVAMNGGVVANAIALPSLRGSSIVFTDTLLSRLSEDEVVAICAHEMAHLEHYNRRRLLFGALVTYGVILVAAALVPIVQRIPDLPDADILWLWPCALFTGLTLAARNRQKNETASDLRAVALTGNADALASALVTIHAIGYIPRRWDQAQERQATHPSLARRIRDIRASAQSGTAGFDAPVTFAAAGGTGGVTFDATHVHWPDKAGATERLAYDSLVELRLDATAGGAVTLVAAGSDGRTWRMSPNTADVPAIQSLLDVVDGRLMAATATSGRPFSAFVARMLAGLAVGLAFLIGQAAFAVAAVFACLSAVPALMFAAGAAGLATTALVLISGTEDIRGTAVLCSTLAGAIIAVAWARRGAKGRGTPALIALLATVTLAVVASVAAGGLNPIRLHEAARTTPAAIVLTTALVVALLTWSQRPAWRWMAVGTAAVILALFAVRSPAFLDLFGRDPLLLPSTPFARMNLGAPLASFPVPFQVDSGTLRLSPSGRLAAIAGEEGDDRPRRKPGRYYITGAGRTPKPLDADDLTFLDDDRAIVFVMLKGSAEIRAVDVESSLIAWSHRLPDLTSGTLMCDRHSLRWTIAGFDRDDRFVHLTGIVGGTDVQEASWALPLGSESWLEGAAARAGTLLAVENDARDSLARRSVLFSLTPALTRRYRHSTVWTVRGGVRRLSWRSLLDTSCGSGTLEDGRLVCASFDGSRTRVTTLDAATGTVTALGTLDGDFSLEGVGPDGWLTGRTIDGPVAVRLSTREHMPFMARRKNGVYEIAGTDALLGTVAWEDSGARIRVYSVKK